MSLKTVLPPQQYLEIVSKSVGQLMAGPEVAGAALRRGAEQTEVAAPHEVYSLGLADAADGDLWKAKKTAWRYLVMQGNRAVAAAELSDAAGGTPVFTHLNTGPFVHGTKQAIAQAETLKVVAEHNFVVRLLAIPALSVLALWLHGENQDLLCPMPPTDSHLTANQWYSPAEFFKLLAPVAAAHQAFDNSPHA